MRRLSHGTEQLQEWRDDLIKLATWRDSWYGQNPLEPSSQDQFFPLFIAFSHLEIDEAREWEALRKSAEILEISVIAFGKDRIWVYRSGFQNQPLCMTSLATTEAEPWCDSIDTFFASVIVPQRPSTSF